MGRHLDIYRKMHPVALVGKDDLEGGVTPGGATPVFACDFGKLGVQICWDIQFDDGWQALANAGAEIVAWPSASPAKALPAARAGRHRYFIVSSTWRDVSVSITIPAKTWACSGRTTRPHPSAPWSAPSAARSSTLSWRAIAGFKTPHGKNDPRARNAWPDAMCGPKLRQLAFNELVSIGAEGSQ